MGTPGSISGNFQSWAHTISLQAAVLLGAPATRAKKKKKKEEKEKKEKEEKKEVKKEENKKKKKF
jgi:ribosomal protein L12E/L44/L45/RPP1/RPP2